ncbi:hypothetical protein JHK85_010498 [Glycine max]|nr:hypothetical protein JHK85_010498 [Glycine max]KAG5066489.1 hypothetical protein JHK86_010220 [Glycine max]
MAEWQSLLQTIFIGLIFSYLLAKLISIFVSFKDVNLTVKRVVAAETTITTHNDAPKCDDTISFDARPFEEESMVAEELILENNNNKVWAWKKLNSKELGLRNSMIAVPTKKKDHFLDLILQGGIIRVWLLMEINYMLAYESGEASLRLLWRFGPLDTLLPFQAAYLVCGGFQRRDKRTNLLLVVRVWDARSGSKTIKLRGHTDNIRALLLDSSGRFVEWISKFSCSFSVYN